MRTKDENFYDEPENIINLMESLSSLALFEFINIIVAE
jgi:hypothetical protein